MKKDYLTTKVEIQSTKIEFAHKIAQKELSEINTINTEIELLKFIAIQLIEIKQKLNEV